MKRIYVYVVALYWINTGKKIENPQHTKSTHYLRFVFHNRRYIIIEIFRGLRFDR